MTGRYPHFIKCPLSLAQFAAAQTRCACCHLPRRQAVYRRNGLDLQIHHLVKRGRSDERCNLLRLCERCHRLAELEQVREAGQLLPKLWFGVCLTLKQESDSAYWKPERLLELYPRQTLPELAPVPEVFLQERERWRWSKAS